MNVLSRREFVRASATFAAAAVALRGETAPDAAEDIVDIHQHGTYSGRPDDELLLHQRNTGVRTTVLLPAGKTGGLAVGAAGSGAVEAFVRSHPDRFVFFANENIYRPEARMEIERGLKRGGIGIGELKDRVACDSPDMVRVAEIARDHGVPVLIHFQDGAYNDGYPRFSRILERFPTVTFIGHALAFWAYVDGGYRPEMGQHPRGPIKPGGLTDRWLGEYPHFYGDLSANSGNGALARDVDFMKNFLARHQDKLLYGSDCPCRTGVGPECIAAVKLRFLRQLCPTPEIRAKILAGNARKLLKLPPPAIPG